MTTAPMTLPDLLDWHARRLGWVKYDGTSGGRWFWGMPNRPTALDYYTHPIEGLDAIADLLPPGWTWDRGWHNGLNPPGRYWTTIRNINESLVIATPDTGDEKHDRALLAKLAWEQEATK